MIPKDVDNLYDKNKFWLSQQVWSPDFLFMFLGLQSTWFDNHFKLSETF